MRPRLATVPCLCALSALAIGVSACGGPAAIESEGIEGEPVEVGELTYNVQITRFLNPNDNEDSEYLVGQPVAPPARTTSASSW